MCSSFGSACFSSGTGACSSAKISGYLSSSASWLCLSTLEWCSSSGCSVKSFGLLSSGTSWLWRSAFECSSAWCSYFFSSRGFAFSYSASCFSSIVAFCGTSWSPSYSLLTLSITSTTNSSAFFSFILRESSSFGDLCSSFYLFSKCLDWGLAFSWWSSWWAVSFFGCSIFVSSYLGETSFDFSFSCFYSTSTGVFTFTSCFYGSGCLWDFEEVGF